jgi:hypothetical protein
VLLGCGTSTVEIVLEHSCVCFDKNPQTFSGATFVTMSKKAGGGSAQDADELSERMGGMALVKSKTRTTDVVIHPFGTIKIAVWNPAAGGKKNVLQWQPHPTLDVLIGHCVQKFYARNCEGF